MNGPARLSTGTSPARSSPSYSQSRPVSKLLHRPIESTRRGDDHSSRNGLNPAWRGGELSFLRVPRESGAKPELSRNCERGVPVRQTPLRRKASGRRAGAAIRKPGDLNAHTGDPSARNGTEASWRSAFSGAFGVV